MILILTLLGNLFWVTQLAWLFRRREWPLLCVGFVFWVCYPLDLLVTLWEGEVFIVPSYGISPVDDGASWLALSMIAISSLVLSFGAWSVASQQPASGRLSSIGFIFGACRGLRLILIAVAFALPTTNAVLANGVQSTLASRQAIFDSGPLELLAYHGIPATVPLFVLYALTSNGSTRLTYWLGSGAMVTLTVLIGSRSGLVLTAGIPSAYLLLRNSAAHFTFSRSLIRFFSFVGAPLLLVGGASWYLRNFRGVEDPRPVFLGPDISQFDVLHQLLREGISAREPTYLTALVWPVPREQWDAKPPTGNLLTSELLTPGRQQLTGAETTAGGLGEAYLNFGPLIGALFFGVLLLVLVRLVARFMRSPQIGFNVLAVVVLARGVNLTRGDIVNVVVPLTVSAVVFLAAGAIRLSHRRTCSPTSRTGPDTNAPPATDTKQ